MLTRAYITLVMVVFAIAPSYAGKPIARDGSTMEKAIPLKQRGPKAIEEEMAWMMKVHGYTPLLASRDVMADAVRKAKATKKAVHAPTPWGHASLDHDGQLCSHWWFLTPRGRKKIYFDTGVPISTPGEVVRQESSRAEYMGRMMESLKL